MKNKILFIGGMDPSGHAGLVRDLQMTSLLKVNPCVAVTALTAQNKNHFASAGVLSANILLRQLKALGPASSFDVIKIGMLGNKALTSTVTTYVTSCKKKPLIILDPVLYSSTGGLLLTPGGQKALWNDLLPLCTLWTPNLPEAEHFLATGSIKRINLQHINKTLKYLWDLKKVPILLKGGHFGKEAIDSFFDGTHFVQFSSKRLHAKLRGTGCALASLIACYLAQGDPVITAIKKSKKISYQLFKQEV